MSARWWRIAPPYYAAIALYFAIPVIYYLLGRDHPGLVEADRKQLVTHFLFLHGFWVDTIFAINIPFWSLSLEFQFYLVFPLLFALSLRFGVVRIVLVVAAMSIGWRFWMASMLPDSFHMSQMIHGIFLGRWTEFALGMAIAFWYNSDVRRSHEQWPWGTLAVLSLGLAVVATDTRHPFALDFFFAVGYASLLAKTLVSADRRGVLGRVMSAPWLVTVGTVSYSLYLTHSFFQLRGFHAYHRLVSNPTVVSDAVVMVVITLMVAVGGGLFHCFVERPFLNFREPGRRPAPVLSPAPVASPAPCRGHRIGLGTGSR